MTHTLESLLATPVPGDAARLRAAAIHRELLSYSRHIQQPNFLRIHPRDLEFLFQAYDARCFDGALRQTLQATPLEFRLSSRMTRAGGSTTRYRTRAGAVSYEIAVAASMLFDQFQQPADRVIVCGIECADRIEALQRIFEHELIHLSEQLCWGHSACSKRRFQQIAAARFHHREHTHAMITRRARAAQSGIVVGSRVSFLFEGQRLQGRVNRITKRATVLVEHPTGILFSDGRRYRTYYVPLSQLEQVHAAGTGAP